MGSLVIGNNGTTEFVESKCIENSPSDKPPVYPCQDCGRYFTFRAMKVHKNTCLENEDCTCSVCMSDYKFRKIHKNDKASSRNNPLKWKISSIAHSTKTRFLNNFTDVHSIEYWKKFDSLETTVIEENIMAVKNLFKKSKSTECATPISDKNERTVLNDHEYTSIRTESLEYSDALSESSNDMVKFSPTVKSKQKDDHDCDRKLFCRYCNLHIFWESFGIHIIQHCQKIDEKLIKCPECDRSFPQPALYLPHYLFHNSEHSLFCMSCRCSYQSCIYTERATEEKFAENYPHHCYICLSYFSHPQTVINHMRLHSKEMPFQCKECNRSFRQIGNLQRHMTTHRGDRPYSCPKCSSSFADPATLRNHERVHTGETPYVCEYCARGFSQIGNLKRHMALHLQKDPSSKTSSSTIEVSSEEHTISIIKPPDDIKVNVNIRNDYSENNNSNDRNTSDNVTNNTETSSETKTTNGTNRKNGTLNVVTCKICSKIYAWQHDLDIHYRTHTGEKPYKCEICGKKFAQSGAINTHKMRHHSGVTNVKRKGVS